MAENDITVTAPEKPWRDLGPLFNAILYWFRSMPRLWRHYFFISLLFFLNLIMALVRHRSCSMILGLLARHPQRTRSALCLPSTLSCHLCRESFVRTDEPMLACRSTRCAIALRKEIPCEAAMIEYIVVGFEDAVRQLVSAADVKPPQPGVTKPPVPPWLQPSKARP